MTDPSGSVAFAVSVMFVPAENDALLFGLVRVTVGGMGVGFTTIVMIFDVVTPF
jgi:uncharacterized membrane protein